MKPTLVVMAAGLGSRYGGLKQMEPVGGQGEILMEYAIYDAIAAGFGKVVFVVREETLDDFRALLGDKLDGRIETAYVTQRLDDLPNGIAPPPGRQKPWGTGQAVWAARYEVDSPFCAINADDFYGREAFETVAAFLRQGGGDLPRRCCLAGYAAANTLTENGTVSRGACTVDEHGMLTAITERLKLRREGDRVVDLDSGVTMAPDAPVSMNLWGFPLGVMEELETAFAAFLQTHGEEEKAEFYLPGFADSLLKSGRGTVALLPVAARWYGVTYREDRPALMQALAELTAAGEYPSGLWSTR